MPPGTRCDGRCGPLVEEERDEQRTNLLNLFRRVLLVLDERGGRTQEAVGLQKNKKQTNTKEFCRLRKVPGTGAFTSTGREEEATTSKGDVREKCARACVCVCTTTPVE